MSIHKPIKCEYNGHVDCETPIRCKTCGWNPSVDQERRERIRDGDYISTVTYIDVNGKTKLYETECLR